jgi:hypothetical protein
VIKYYQGAHIIFYVYRRDGDYKLVGRLVYDTSTLAPFKKGVDTKINALSLGDSFNDSNEFLKRILAVNEWRQKGGGHGEDS